MPNGLVYVSDDSNGDYDSVSGIWTIGLLQNKASVTLNILSLVNISNATITNVAVVDSDTYDPNETPKMGDNITWTIRVTNNGPDTAVNAFVRDILPTGLIYLSDDGKGNYTNNIWNIGNMTSGATAVLHIVTQVDVDEAVITNVANVTSDTPEYDLTNNEDNATIDVGHEADLAIVKVVSNSTPRRGDNITWTITLKEFGLSE